MKTEPTALEQYQSARIIALENALKEAQNDLKELSRLSDAAALKIRVNDPVFEKQIHDVDYEIINACRHDQFDIDALGRTVCTECRTPKYSSNQ